jgi:citrate lyase subunit gamma (acyl carrier protein)
MDCLVTVTESEGGRRIEVSGSGASRFRGAIEAKVNQVLDELGRSGDPCASSVVVSVQDNGALDIVLGARVEAAYRRLREDALS